MASGTCTGTIRFFLHTFLFVSNHSSSASSSTAGSGSSGYYHGGTQAFALNGDNKSLAAVYWVAGGPADNITRPARRSGDLQQALECMQMYILPACIVLGVVGSVVGNMVLLATHLRYKFFSHFLVCMNVSSASFLLTVFMSWLADNGIDVFGAPGLCQVHVFSSHFFTFLSVWNGVLGAYLVLWDWIRPREVPWLNSPTAAKVAVVSLAVLGFTVYSYKTWTHFSLVHRGSRVCTVIPENEPAMEILNVLDVLVLLVIPSLCYVAFVFIVLFRRLRPYCQSCSYCCCCVRASGSSSSRKICSRGRDRVIYTCPSGDVIAEIGLAMVRHDAVPKLLEVHRLVLGQAACFLLLVTPRAVSTMMVIVSRWVYHRKQATDDILLHHVFQFSFYFYFAVLPLCPAFTSGKFRLHCCALFSRRPRLRHPSPVVMQVE